MIPVLSHLFLSILGEAAYLRGALQVLVEPF